MASKGGLLSDLQLKQWIKAGKPLAMTDAVGSRKEVMPTLDSRAKGCGGEGASRLERLVVAAAMR